MLGYGRPSEMKTGAASSCMTLTCCLRTTTTPTPATNSSPHTCLWPWTSSDTGRSTVCMCARMDLYINVLCWGIIFKVAHCWCDPPRLPYPQYFGGVSAVTPDQYMKMNGFPNQYWGWGGEDDDIAARWGGWLGQRSTSCMTTEWTVKRCERCARVLSNRIACTPFQPLHFLYFSYHLLLYSFAFFLIFTVFITTCFPFLWLLFYVP